MQELHFPMFFNRFSSVTCIVQVESLTNQEEVELRSKIEALGLEVTKVPSKAVQPLGEVILSPPYIMSHIFSLTPTSMCF